MLRLISASLAVAALATGLSACGEKDEAPPTTPTADASGQTTPAGPGDPGATGGNGGGELTPKQQIAATVTAVLGGGKPDEVCGDLVTAGYVKKAYGGEGGCRAAAQSQKRVGVAVSKVQIMGNLATAEAVPDGGPNKGETIKVRLVLDGKAYRVDSAVSNAPAGP